MSGLSIFLYFWLATILVAFFAQGRWGTELAKAGLISPIPVAFLWPVGLIVGAFAAPFALIYFIGEWTKGSGDE